MRELPPPLTKEHVPHVTCNTLLMSHDTSPCHTKDFGGGLFVRYSKVLYMQNSRSDQIKSTDYESLDGVVASLGHDVVTSLICETKGCTVP